ncbi:MAG: tetratricopeptide repeat protein [Cellulophaga sp.]
MRKKKTALLLCFVGAICIGFSQESKIYTHHQKDYQEALSLYNNKQYQTAQTLFEKVKSATDDLETEANSAYYVANSAIRLNQRGADRLMEDFVERYLTSTKRNSAFSDVADYYFETGKYPHALKWYKKVKQGAMSRKEKERFNFNFGYALFSSKKQKEAERYFNKVINSQTYGSQAKYYLGYISYQNDDYDAANQRFDQITDQDLLKEKLSYYQADMNFKLGNFDKAIALAKKQLLKADRKEVSELNKIIGESYFNLKKYDVAIPHLEKYKGKRGKWNNTDYYLLGYCYYMQKDYANAIQQFNKIIGGANSVSQNAYYHLAECYLKLEKKQEALNAFRNASQMDFTSEIQQDAYLNYARLSYEIGNAYESVPQVLSNFLENYPKDKHGKEIQELLVDSYITSRNFEGALALLEANRGYASKTTFQKVAFYRAVELFVATDYSGAHVHFKKSLDNAEDVLFAARATYWKAESDYMLNRFTEALKGFVAFKKSPSAMAIHEYKDVAYNLAYTYFKLKKYDNAITGFTEFTTKNNVNQEKLNDAYLRLGDSYFVSSKYWPAIESYNKALASNGGEKDYAAFQKALSYGFVDRSEKKISGLISFVSTYPKSTLKDDALFELGNTYIKANETDKGLRAYEKLIGNYKGSSFVPKAMLRQGLVYYNTNQNEKALIKFKGVVRDYSNTQEAIQAVATAKFIYVDLGRVDEYAAWVEKLDFVEVTDSELDNATFESADKQYLQGNTNVAIKGLHNYMEKFPNGLHATQANFNLAQLYFGVDEKEKALPYYEFVANKGVSEFAEQSLTRVCEIYAGKKEYASAIPFLERLENTAEIKQNITFAQSNLMKAYYAQKNYAKTIAYAEKVLATSKIDDRIKSDAHTMIARSAINTNNADRAEKAYKAVLKIATGKLAAEAWYYDAFYKHKKQNYEASNTAVQKLAKDYSAYKEWGGKGLILMAKNFYALGDAFQATYILDSVIENFKPYPEVVEQAKREVVIIKTKEAKSNSSVNPDEN